MKFYQYATALFIAFAMLLFSNSARAADHSNRINLGHTFQNDTTPTSPQPTTTDTQQQVEPTASQTSTLEASPTPTAIATEQPTDSIPTSTPAGYRPVIIISAYQTKPALVSPGKNFTLEIKLVNQGQLSAHNLIITIPTGDLIPLETGGVIAVGKLSDGEKSTIKQPMSATMALAGNSVATLAINLSYTDPNGIIYNEIFTIAINLEKIYTGSATSATATPIPSFNKRAQLVIKSYQTDIETLQPGTQFMLELVIQNSGSVAADQVIMVVGGATISVSPVGETGNDSQSNTGNIIASGGEFTNFSPTGLSNVQSIGDITVGDELTINQPLIVNVSTNPGVYPLKISFAYRDEKGNLFIDDQVISLMVYSLPVITMNFYRDPGPIYASQPNILPIQIINMGKKTAILGSINVSAESGYMENSTLFIGALEPGGYYTLDAVYTPESVGVVDLQLTIEYSDDFNIPHTIIETIPLEIQEFVVEPSSDPGSYPGMAVPGESPTGVGPESTWQVIKRLLAGLLGLDSSPTPVFPESDTPGPVEPSPDQTTPAEIPVRPAGKG